MKRRYKTTLWVVASIIAFLFIAYQAIFNFGLLEWVVNARLNQLIKGKFPVTIHIGKLSGDYFSDLQVQNVRVNYNDNVESYELAFIPRLTAEYSLTNLINGQLEFAKIYIDSANINLKKNSDGDWLLPKPQKSGSGPSKGLEFAVDEFGLNNLTINLISPTDTVTFSDIILAAHIEGLGQTYGVDIDALSYVSSDSRFSLKSGGGKATLTGNNLIFQDIFVMTDSSDIQLGGQVLLEKTPVLRVDLEAKQMNIREIFALLNINLHGQVSANGYVEYQKGELSGAVIINGEFMDRQFDSLFTKFSFYDNQLTFDTLSGKILGGTIINANGEIDLKLHPEQYKLSGNIKHFNLDNLIYNTFQTDLNGKLALDGQGLSGSSLLLDCVVDLSESWFDQYHAHNATGSLTITTDSLRFYDNFTIKYFDNIFYAGGLLVYNGDINVEGRADFRDLSAFNDKIFIKELGGRGRFIGELSGELKNPDLSGIFLSDSLWMYQIYSAGARTEFNLKHFIYDRDGYANLSLYDGTAYSIPHDSAWISMKIDSQYVTIDTARYFNPYTDLSCIGNLDYASYPQKLILDSIEVSIFDLPFNNERPAQIYVDSSGFEFRQCGLHRPVGFIGWNGRINYDETLNMTIGVRSIKIKPWVNLLTDEYDIGGRLSGLTNLSGPFISPLIDFSGLVDSLSFEKLTLGDLKADFKYANENISIDSVTLESPNGKYFAQGDYPINLALVEVHERFPDKQQNIKIKAEDLRFDFISLVLQEVEDMVGDFKAELTLTGTPLRPNFNGWATVKDGSIKLYDLKKPLNKLNISLKMNGKEILFDDVSAICENGKGTKGTVDASGKINIISIDNFDYDINVKAKNFTADYELGDLKATIDADISVEGQTPPTAYGDLYVSKAEYRENFASENEGWILLETFEGENSWDLNLNAEFPSNCWIKNDDIDAEFSGNINFIRESGRYRYIGNMQVLRGKAYYAGRTWRLESGGTITYDDIEHPNPRLDITATTKVRTTSTTLIADQSSSEEVDIGIRVTNTLDEPIIAAAEGSNMSIEQIMPFLATNYYQDENGAAPSKWFENRMATAAADYISTQMTQIGSRSLGVETFEIDPVYGDKYDPLGTRVTVGFYTHPNLYIYGRSAISGNAGQQVGFEYRMGKFMLLEGRADENDLYQLYLNFYWEY